MRIAPGGPHLTYCTNIHAGESWPQVRANLETHVVAVKRRVAPDRPMGVGLRLSAAAAEALARPGETAALAAWLREQDLYVFTINGFPYGAFHRTRVKEQVYRPDWLEDARADYADRLARLLADLLPDGVEGSVSTVPVAFAPRVASAADADAAADRIARHAARLAEIAARTGKTIALALEPEPGCHVETAADAIAFLGRVWRRGDERTLRRHVGVCFDACHMAVAWEDPGDALARLRAAGIRVAKIQISAGLEVPAGAGPEAVRELSRFADDVYLHQVVERREDGLARFADLPDALATPARGDRRVHFHVPIFYESLGPFRSTQPWLRALLSEVRRDPPSAHFEVETYTWDVLPEEHRREDVDDAIAREMAWALACLT